MWRFARANVGRLRSFEFDPRTQRNSTAHIKCYRDCRRDSSTSTCPACSGLRLEIVQFTGFPAFTECSNALQIERPWRTNGLWRSDGQRSKPFQRLDQLPSVTDIVACLGHGHGFALHRLRIYPQALTRAHRHSPPDLSSFDAGWGWAAHHNFDKAEKTWGRERESCWSEGGF